MINNRYSNKLPWVGDLRPCLSSVGGGPKFPNLMNGLLINDLHMNSLFRRGL